MRKYRHNVLKELWWNRPWVYIPAVIRTMKPAPWKKKTPYFKFRTWIRNVCYINWQTCLEEVPIEKTADDRKWYQKMLGYCPYCRRWFRKGVKGRRQNTAYCDEADNWIAACPECFAEIQSLWAELWAEYPC